MSVDTKRAHELCDAHDREHEHGGGSRGPCWECGARSELRKLADEVDRLREENSRQAGYISAQNDVGKIADGYMREVSRLRKKQKTHKPLLAAAKNHAFNCLTKGSRDVLLSAIAACEEEE